MFAGCVNNISKAKKKVSTITSVGFKTLKEYAKNWTAVDKGQSSFQNFHLILDKCNTITAELLENETEMSPPVLPQFHK